MRYRQSSKRLDQKLQQKHGKAIINILQEIALLHNYDFRQF